jgi:hypothetical protein
VFEAATILAESSTIFTPDAGRWIGLALVLIVGSVLQGAVGFAAGLLGIPLLLWLDWSLAESQVIVITSTAVQNSWGLYRYRNTLDKQEILFPAFLRLAFIPLGIFCLRGLQQLPPDQIKQFVGGVLLLITFGLLKFHPRAQNSVPRIWTWTIFPLSGLMQGMLGMGGPAMVLWVQMHDWSTQRSRAFLFAIYLISLPFSLTFLYASFGREILTALLTTLTMLPLVIAATGAGLWLGTRIGRRRMRRLTMWILLLIALINLSAPYMLRIAVVLRLVEFREVDSLSLLFLDELDSGF